MIQVRIGASGPERERPSIEQLVFLIEEPEVTGTVRSFLAKNLVQIMCRDDGIGEGEPLIVLDPRVRHVGESYKQHLVPPLVSSNKKSLPIGTLRKCALEFDILVDHLGERECAHDDDQTDGAPDKPADGFRAATIPAEDEVEAPDRKGDGRGDNRESLKELKQAEPCLIESHVVPSLVLVRRRLEAELRLERLQNEFLVVLDDLLMLFVEPFLIVLPTDA